MELLLNGITEELHRSIGTHESAATERHCIVRARIEELFESAQCNGFEAHLAGRDKSSEFRLAADQRILPSFETKGSSFTGAGLLPFGTAAGGGTATSTVAAGHTLARSDSTSLRTEQMKHRRES